jgi:hypothetical protein
MAKLTALGDAFSTVKKWAAQMRALTFEDNFQTQVQIKDLIEGDFLRYRREDNKFFNDDFYEDWTEWVPTFPNSGSMAFAETTRTYCEYCRVGNLWHFALDIEGTTSGTANTSILVTPPSHFIAARNHNSLPVYVRDATSGVLTNGQLQVTAANGLAFFKNDVTNWGLNTGRIIRANVFCRGV